jgi:hypothetical protein
MYTKAGIFGMQKCHLVTLEDAAAQWKSDKKINEK